MFEIDPFFYFGPSTASQIGKFDTETKETVYWGEENCWPSEPVFVPRPNGESEDDGESGLQNQSDYRDIFRSGTMTSLSLFVCRRGFISRHQLQPGPEVLHCGY